MPPNQTKPKKSPPLFILFFFLKIINFQTNMSLIILFFFTTLRLVNSINFFFLFLTSNDTHNDMLTPMRICIIAPNFAGKKFLLVVGGVL